MDLGEGGGGGMITWHPRSPAFLALLSCLPLCLEYLREAVQTTCHHTHTPNTHSWSVLESN